MAFGNVFKQKWNLKRLHLKSNLSMLQTWNTLVSLSNLLVLHLNVPLNWTLIWQILPHVITSDTQTRHDANGTGMYIKDFDWGHKLSLYCLSISTGHCSEHQDWREEPGHAKLASKPPHAMKTASLLLCLSNVWQQIICRYRNWITKNHSCPSTVHFDMLLLLYF